MRHIGRPIAEGTLDAPFYSFRRQALGDSARQSHSIPTLSLTWVKAFERAQPVRSRAPHRQDVDSK
jgi:hypothetical protein